MTTVARLSRPRPLSRRTKYSMAVFLFMSLFVLLYSCAVYSQLDLSSFGGHLPSAGPRPPLYDVDSPHLLDRLPEPRPELDAAAAATSSSEQQGGLSVYNPIIFVPGDGGSQLEAKLNKTHRVHYLCTLQSDWYDLWLNIHLLAPMAFDCLIDNMILSYNNTTRLTSNSEGVEVRPTNFGALEPVAYLDIYRIPKTDYFERIIAAIESKHNMKRNVDMLGASFDFRKAPNELDDFFANLTRLIEDQYVLSEYKPVTLICHSMGCLNSVLLLNNKTDVWKDIYVKRLVALGSPWDGSFKAINAMIFGDNLGIPLLNTEKLQLLQRSFPSLMYLFPKAPTFEPNRTLVSSPNLNYTLENLDQLFDTLKLDDQKQMWHDTRKIASSIKAPNVELWCLYGQGIDTPTKIIFNDSIDSPKTSYAIENGDGDGTVNIESLVACDNFRLKQTKPVYMKKFPGVDHIDILRSQVPADFIAEQIIPHDLDP